MRQIIENVMSMARRENSRPERVILATWLGGFLEEFCATMQIPVNRLAISSLLGDVEVQVDPSQLRQIVWNLCENAVKYGVGEAGSALIDLRVGRLASTARPFLEVADRGPGIAPQDRERVFGRFVRLDANRSRSAGGAGLGLAIVREIVVAHQGSVAISDAPGGGARVTVQLPLAYAPDSSR